MLEGEDRERALALIHSETPLATRSDPDEAACVLAALEREFVLVRPKVNKKGECDCDLCCHDFEQGASCNLALGESKELGAESPGKGCIAYKKEPEHAGG